VNNDSSEFVLPNVDRWHRIWLRFVGTMTVTLGGGTATALATAPFSVMRRVTLTLQGYRGLGNTTLYSLSGFQASIFLRVENPNYTDNFTAPVAAGANAWTFNLMLPISVGETDFAGMLKLAGDKSATLTIRIDWANANQTGNGTSDVITLAGGAANSAVLTGTATIVSETFQFLAGEAERLGLRQDIVHQLTSRTDQLVGTAPFDVPLTIGMFYLRLIFLTTNNGAFANGVHDLFDLVVEEAVHPYTIREDEWRGQARYRNLSDYPTGVYALDRYWTRTWRDVYDATALTTFKATFNIVAAIVAPANIQTIREVAIVTPAAAREAKAA
jgi:hypothetical protein